MPNARHRSIPIRDLVLIPELSPRAGLCEETVIRYMDSFASLPPVRTQEGTNVVVDGYHRVEAAVRLGLEEVPVAAEPVPDEELRLAAGVANVAHGQPLTRAERNQLAVALVRTYGKHREEVARLLGMSPAAVTLALREQQFNEMLSEKLGAPVQVINSAHVRALYRVGTDQRERLLEAVVTKVDRDGQPYPLTGAELKILVDRMLDPSTPIPELNRLLQDPKARPRTAPAPSGNGDGPIPAPGAEGLPATAEDGCHPWEREWQSPLRSGDGEAFDRMRALDERIARRDAGLNGERQVAELPRRAGEHAREQALLLDDPEWSDAAPNSSPDRLRAGLAAATRALEELIPRVEPADLRREIEAVLSLLHNLQR
jgi:hypothetical protein